jgi:uncharacterized protein (TIGR02246 family)
MSAGQGKRDEAAIRNILQEEAAAWNKGDAQAYSQHFAADGTFTNILGMFFTGHQAFLDRHEEIFKGRFRGTVLRQDVVSLKFVRPDAAWKHSHGFRGFQHRVRHQACSPIGKGRLRTRPLQVMVMVKEAGDWKITDYHNVDVKPGVTVPEPQ